MKESEVMAAGSLGVARVVDFLRDPNNVALTARDIEAARLGLGTASTAVRYYAAKTNRQATELAARRFETLTPTITGHVPAPVQIEATKPAKKK